MGEEGAAVPNLAEHAGLSVGSSRPSLTAELCLTDILQPAVLFVFSVEKPRFITPLNGLTHSEGGGLGLSGTP